MIEIRQAAPEDALAMGALWHDAWNDGHRGLVPEGIYAHRTRDSFLARAAERVSDSSVAINEDGRLAGFVTVRGDELEQFFIAREARGTGLSHRLMAEGERRLALGRIKRAHLEVVAGNDRAIGFYEKAGWTNMGLVTYEAQIADGTFALSCLRFEKDIPPRDIPQPTENE